MTHKVLELFSGIGGMHWAFTLSNVPGEIVSAADINPIANTVYAHNFPKTKLFNNNIQKFTAKFINNSGANTILMSPPCQPFTRVGNQKDLDDNRSNALVHICQILPELHSIDSILMENVKGFETSKARDLFVETLQQSGFDFREFLLSPSQISIPNTRYRYYCLARRSTRPFGFDGNFLIEEFPVKNLNGKDCSKESLRNFIDLNESYEDNDNFLLSDDVLLKRSSLLDISYPESINTICFTKAYTHYTEGTGSVFCPHSKDTVDNVFKSCKDRPDEWLDLLKTLRLRYFTPAEVSRLMCFPKEFSFPESVTIKQRYRLLGNSINVKVVSELIKVVLNE